MGRHRYPANRKSPVYHTVKAYNRRSGHVQSHSRGRGASQRSRSHKTVKSDTEFPKAHAFTANLKYSNQPGDGESILVVGTNYADVLDEVWEEKTDPRQPVEIEVVDPDFEHALKVLSEKVQGAYEYGKPRIVKAAKVGARYGIRASMASAKTVGRVAKGTFNASVYELQKKYIQHLVNQCYSKDRVERVAARAALRSRYPSVFEMCTFSRETRRRR